MTVKEWPKGLGISVTEVVVGKLDGVHSARPKFSAGAGAEGFLL